MKNAYDVRSVRYEKITNFTGDMFSKLVELVSPVENEHILEGGSGYAPVTRALLEKCGKADIKYHILELSKMQIERAKSELADYLKDTAYYEKNLRFYNCPLEEPPFEDNSIDKIVLKIVLHELPAPAQLTALKELSRSLKPTGKLFIWQTINNEQTINFFRRVMRRKDELAGFESMVVNRNFITEERLYDLLHTVGLKNVKKEVEFDYHFNSKFRIDDEFGGSMETLNIYNNYLLGMVDALGDDFKNKIRFSYVDNNFSFFLKQGIYSATK